MTAHRPQTRRRESTPIISPHSPQSLAFREDTGATPCFRRQPETALQALMETAPGQEPEISSEEVENVVGGRATDALAALSPRHREAFALSRLAGLPYTEVAKRLGVSKTTAFRLANEAHALLVKALETP
jgi:RNA polymerase sigma factor (sigma-70 family)